MDIENYALIATRIKNMDKIQTNVNQWNFLKLSSLLLNFVVYYCEKNRIMATWGDAYRDPRCPYGSEVSRHHQRLAIDINLIKDGVLIKGSEGHEDIGMFWLSLDKRCTWGGAWSDYNHYSYLE